MTSRLACAGFAALVLGVWTLQAQGQTKPTPPASSSVRWTTFRDPAEGAFTIEVPAGWRVSGGSRRRSAVDIPSGVEAASPDGSILLFFGDPVLPVFSVPNRLTAAAGLREGMNYPGMANVILARYQPGAQFAAAWGAQRVARVCAQPQVKAARARPEASRSIDMAYAAGGVRTQVEVGEAVFACTLGGAAGGAYAFAGTELVQTTGTAMWDLKVGGGFAARSDRMALASALLSHMAASYAIDPSWLQRQQGTTMAVSRITTETGHAISKTIDDSFAFRQGQYAHTDEFDRAIRGMAVFNDPVKGPVELENRDYQWKLPNGQTQATNSPNPPVPGAVLMPRQGQK
jgi:hypothetical protein